MAIATDRQACGSVVAQRKEGQVLGVDAEQGDIVGLVGGEDFDDREESPVEGEHAHRFAGRACGHMVIGGDDAVIGDGEAARQSIMPFGAFIAFVGGSDEYGRLGAAPIDIRTFERCTGARLSGKTNGIGTRAFALFEPVFAPERANTFFRQGRGRGFELLEHHTIVDGTIDVRAWDDRGSSDKSSEQRGEKHASIEANGRSVTSLSVRIRREHTRGLKRRTCLGDGGLNRSGAEEGEGVRASRKGVRLAGIGLH